MKNPKVVAIIQARMNSTRLPGKVLLPLGPDNKSVLWWMATRAGLAELVDEVWVATTRAESNIPIVDYCFKNKIISYAFGGKEDDVIGRVMACANFAKADIIIDITADCPMIDPRHIDYLINDLIEDEWDYSSNCIYRDWPDGLDIQVYWTGTLQACITMYNPKQHVGWNIPRCWGTFSCNHYKAPLTMHWPDLGLTLDTPEDYAMLLQLFDKFGDNPAFTAEAVVNFLSKNPDWITNKEIKRKAPEEG